MSRCGSFWVYSTWCLFRLLDVQINIFDQIWEVWAIISSTILSSLLFFLFLGLPLFIFWYTWWQPIGVWGSVIFLHSCFFLFLRLISEKVHWFFPLPVQIYCWAPLVNIVFFNSRISICFFILCFYWCFQFAEIAFSFSLNSFLKFLLDYSW